MVKDSPLDFKEDTSICIHAVAEDGTIKYANDFELALLGYGYDEYIGQLKIDFLMDNELRHFLDQSNGNPKNIQNFPTMLKGKKGPIYICYDTDIYEDNGRYAHNRYFGNVITEEEYNKLKKQILKLHGNGVEL